MDADRICLAYTYAACVHLLVCTSVLAAAYQLFGAQVAAWALGAVCLSCIGVPFMARIALSLRPRPAIIAASGGGVGLGLDAGALPSVKREDRAAEGSNFLSLVREFELVRRLPACGHCIDNWLRLRAHPTCPLCRAAARRPELPV